MKKAVGYILAIIGLAGLALTFPAVPQALNLTIPPGITNNTLTVVSLVVVVIGIFIAIRGGKEGKSRQKATEVPIYHGRDIVGYRRG